MLWNEAVPSHPLHYDLQSLLGQVGVLPALDPSAVVGAGEAPGQARPLLQGSDLAFQEVTKHMQQG